MCYFRAVSLGIESNTNSESIFSWMFRKKESLEQVAFFFVSQLNANNARYSPLFEFTKDIRIVYLKGWKVKYSDTILLLFFKLIPFIFSRKIQKYNILHTFSIASWPKTKKQILHVDDPLYTISENFALRKWEMQLTKKNSQQVLICTNQFTYSWFKNILPKTKIIIVEQGYYSAKPKKYRRKPEYFSCVYSSPYIHFGSDLHGSHSTWGAGTLVKDLIPKLSRLDPSIKIHLVGEIGKNALRELRTYSNWESYGRVDHFENQEIISKCDIGIYPRFFDHRRSILKVYSYIGAGLPVVTFDLVDTSIIKKYQLGPTVSNIDDFVKSIVELKNSPELMEFYKKNIDKIKANFNWTNLALKMETEIRSL